MHDWLAVELARERNAQILAEAEERRLARPAAGTGASPSLRARMARKLFAFAVTVEREETWRAVWERLEAPRHP
ncbi:MAG: hypothetical protein M3151_13990 [Actinomycetota bacterium]|nr:hypothetical protein [Actinomycetota bacterium]